MVLEFIENVLKLIFSALTEDYTTSYMYSAADPLSIAMASAAAIQVGKGIYDDYQSRKKMSELGDRPAYETPAEAEEALDVTRTMGRYMSQQGLPEESRRLQQQGAERATTLGVRTLQDRGSGVAGVGAMTQGLADSYTQMAAMDAQARLQNMRSYQQDLTGALNQMAGFREKEIFDEQGNYDVRYAEAMGQREAGQRQMMAGMQTGVNAIGAGLTDPYAGSNNKTPSSLPAGIDSPGQDIMKLRYLWQPSGGVGLRGNRSPFNEQIPVVGNYFSNK